MTGPASQPGGGATDAVAGVIARPPLIYLAALLLGVAAERLFPLGDLPGWARLGIGPAAVAVALGLFAACLRRFRAAGTSIPTDVPTRALVTDGPYRMSRNPIYLSLTLLYAGIALVAGSA
jgi:protein-S-isoprenylcysteine O-methyltransferase Ste14